MQPQARATSHAAEPSRRDSAAAIAAGANFAKRRGGNPVILALAADHVVADTESFRASCRAARDAAHRGYIVTFGVKPDRPAVVSTARTITYGELDRHATRIARPRQHPRRQRQRAAQLHRQHRF